MAWEWVAPVVVGTVGIAGIASTWLTARGQRDHQLKLHEQSLIKDEQQELRNVRREVYVKYLAVLHEFLEDRQSRLQMFRAWQEVAIVADSQVRLCAREAHDAAIRIIDLEEQQGPVRDECLYALGEALGELIDEMAKEVVVGVRGESPPDNEHWHSSVEGVRLG